MCGVEEGVFVVPTVCFYRLAPLVLNGALFGVLCFCGCSPRALFPGNWLQLWLASWKRQLSVCNVLMRMVGYLFRPG